MDFTINSSHLYFLITCVFSVLGIIALIYFILILRRLAKTSKSIDIKIKTILDNVDNILQVVKDNQSSLDTTIKSVGNITSDISSVTNNVNQTVNDVKDVFDSTKNLTQKITMIGNIVAKAAQTASEKQEKQKEAANNNNNGEVEITNVKLEVENE